MKAHSRKERQKCNNFEWMLRKCDLKALKIKQASGVTSHSGHNLPLEWGHLCPQDVCPSLESSALEGGCPANGKGGAKAGGQRVSSLFFKSLVILLKKKKKKIQNLQTTQQIHKCYKSHISWPIFLFFVCLSWWCGSCNNLFPLMILASFPRLLSSHSLMLFWPMIPGSLVTMPAGLPVTQH